MSTTTLDELEFVGKNNIPSFKGVYMFDDLKEFPQSEKFSAVYNLDKKGSGTHWVGLYGDDTYTFYFDPVGGIPDQVLKPILKADPKKAHLYSNTPIQELGTTCCGQLVLYCLHLLDKGVSPFRITKMNKNQSKEFIRKAVEWFQNKS